MKITGKKGILLAVNKYNADQEKQQANCITLIFRAMLNWLITLLLLCVCQSNSARFRMKPDEEARPDEEAKIDEEETPDDEANELTFGSRLPVFDR